MAIMVPNGPAIWGGCVTWRSHPATSCCFSYKAVPVARQVWRTFCRHGTNLIEHYACRGINMIEATNLSPVTKLVVGTGAVSRNNLSWSQRTVMVRDSDCVQMRVSGCKNHYKFVLGAGAKAKSVTNNLPILSVLYVGLFLKLSRCERNIWSVKRYYFFISSNFTTLYSTLNSLAYSSIVSLKPACFLNLLMFVGSLIGQTILLVSPFFKRPLHN